MTANPCPPRRDFPDDTGAEHLVERWRLACREYRVAAERGVLSWRLVLRREYRLAMATRHPESLSLALRRLAAVSLEWAEAVEARDQEVRVAYADMSAGYHPDEAGGDRHGV